jgi:hypothetical protein
MRVSSCVSLATGPVAIALLLALPPRCAPILAQAPAPTSAQTPSPSPAPTGLTIRMLNGKSGKPLGNRFIAVEFQNTPEKKSMIYINKQGIGDLEIPPGATAFSLIAPAKKRGANQAAYIVCAAFGQFIPVQDVLLHGYVPHDDCNANLKLTAAPGELLYLIQPLPWYTPALE